MHCRIAFSLLIGFNPRLHEGGDIHRWSILWRKFEFQSTPPRGRRRFFGYTPTNRAKFYPERLEKVETVAFAEATVSQEQNNRIV